MSTKTTARKRVVPSKYGKTTVGDDGEEKVVMLKDNAQRWKKWWTRFYSTWLMIGGFALLIWAGHLALIMFVVALQLGSFREIMNIREEKMKRKKQSMDEEDADDLIPTHKLLDSWFFAVTLYSINASTFFARFPSFFQANSVSYFLMQHHRFLCFSFYIMGFIFFVITLEKGKYKKQFQKLAWSIITMLVVAYAGSFHVVNILQGLYWFLLPCLLVICNDIWAFVWGFHFGRTPLIQLSPRKTWEGFIGAFFSTIIFGFFFAYLMAQFDFLICPRDEFLSFSGECTPHPVFELTTYHLPSELVSLLSHIGFNQTSIQLYPVQLHSIALSIFASLIAPFGGFFGSGFKRAFEIDDFGDSIPGHGGITDRMDCQFIMGGCSSVYYSTFVHLAPVSIAGMRAALLTLTSDQQVQIFNELSELLKDKGIL